MGAGGGTLSDAQKAAAFDSSARILVAAGAGSGKTRLLVAYFLRALLDEGIPPERLIAVTFTKKAASELVERIQERLKELGRSDLIPPLDDATIGTIHSLCAGLLREHPLEAGVDPDFRVLEAEAATLVEKEVRDEVWRRTVEAATNAELDVLGAYSRLLQEEVVPLYGRLRGAGEESPQVTITTSGKPEESRGRLIEAIRQALDVGWAADRRGKSLVSDLERLDRCLSLIEPFEGGVDPQEQLGLTLGCFPSRATAFMGPYFEAVRAALTAYRLDLAEQELRPVVAVMNELLGRFHQAYTAYKRERSLLDFTDLELHARALLRTRMVTAKTSLRTGPWVMIDEFQDTNELQCSILEGLGAARLLMVGDERQSIYRFRGADVEVFRRRETASELPDGGTRVHRLDVNYRSREKIISFINRLFADEGFFGKRFVELQCGCDDHGGHQLHGATGGGAADRGGECNSTGPTGAEPGGKEMSSVAGAGSRPESPPTAVEILSVERSAKPEPDAPSPPMQEAEARAVALAVRRLLDQEGWEPRDIVVLTPAQTHVHLYQQSLLDQKIRVYVVGGRGYYSREEVADLSAFLKLLVNPHDDLRLVTVLRSPMAGLSDDGLYILGREARRRRARSLWEVAREGDISGMSQADQKLLAGFVQCLAILRTRVGRPGLARLIDDAVSDCGYDVCLLASDEGKRRFANVRKLMRIADDYEALEGPDLAGLVSLIESMGELSDREGSAPTLAEGENVVRVMTVHQAKGLEFPVVVLAGLGSDAPRGNRPRFAIGSDGRMGVFLKGSGHKTYEPGDLSWGPAADIVADEAAKEREEDIRLLYVAMTRAKHRLVLVGAKPTGRSLSACRIGRIAMALRLESLPEPGTTVPLAGLDAVITGIDASLAAGGPCLSDGGPGLPETPAVEERGRVAVDPAARPEPEPVVVPPGPCFYRPENDLPDIAPHQVSFSALALYLRCPRRFYLERVLGLGPDFCEPPGTSLTYPDRYGEGPEVEEDVSALQDELADDADTRSGRAIGLLVHALLERHALETECPSSASLASEVDALIREMSLGSSPSQAEIARVSALTQAFWRSPLAGRRTTAGADREAAFVFALGDVSVSGVMDLIWSDESVWHIVDYKTNRLEGRTPEEVAAAYELQGAIYALAALRAGAEAVSMDFLFLERPGSPVSWSFNKEDKPRLESTLERILDELKRGDFQAKPGEDCARCPASPLCDAMAGPEAHGIE